MGEFKNMWRERCCNGDCFEGQNALIRCYSFFSYTGLCGHTAKELVSQDSGNRTRDLHLGHDNRLLECKQPNAPRGVSFRVTFGLSIGTVNVSLRGDKNNQTYLTALVWDGWSTQLYSFFTLDVASALHCERTANSIQCLPYGKMDYMILVVAGSVYQT